MIRTLTAALLGGLLLMSAPACTREEAAPQPEFYVRADQDGQAWLGPGEATYLPQQGTVYVFGERNDGTSRQSYLRLGFTWEPEHPLTPAGAADARVLPAEWQVVVGGDVLVDSYAADSGATRLLITRLDTVERIIEGTFEATLRRAARWPPPGPATTRFTQGSFRVRYQSYP
jgi:hypothetical protein